MIQAAHAAHPELSVRHLCAVFEVGRTWCYTHSSTEETASRDMALAVRDRDDRAVLPGLRVSTRC